MVEKKGLRDHDPDRQMTYLALSPQAATREAKFVTAIVPLRKTDVGLGPEMDALIDDDAVGVRIGAGKTVTEVWLNLRADGQRMHRNSNNVIDGWDTDAYLLALTRPVGADANDPDSITRCFVACGSYLRKNGKVLLHSLSKVDAIFTCREPQMQITLHGQPITRASLRA